jgi:RimJ/RimL family protein N-acetyltransferase
MLKTQRLRLRQCHRDDLPSFAKLNGDPEVMAFYPKPLTAQESDNFALRVQSLICARGWGFWAIEVPAQARFIGFVGLHQPLGPKHSVVAQKFRDLALFPRRFYQHKIFITPNYFSN